MWLYVGAVHLRRWLTKRKAERARAKEEALDNAWFERLHEGTVLVLTTSDGGSMKHPVCYRDGCLYAFGTYIEPRLRCHFTVEEPSGPW